MTRHLSGRAGRAVAVGLFAALVTAATGITPASAATPHGLGFSQLNGRLGGNTAVGVDAAGNIYFAGSSTTSIPTTPGALQSTPTGTFLVSTDPGGAQIRYATYLPGGVADLAVNPDGSVVFAGAGGTFAPTPGAFQPEDQNRAGTYVAEIDPTGSRLVYASYLSGLPGPLGRGGNDMIASVAVDPAGTAYVTGMTSSTKHSNFPVTSDAYQVRNTEPDGSFDAFLTVVSPTGGLVYGTFLGGTLDLLASDNEKTDFGYGVAADSTGAYVTGWTGTTGFPNTANLRGPTERRANNGNLFVTKFRRNTGALGAAYKLDYSVFPARARAFDIAADGTGSVYVTGETGPTVDRTGAFTDDLPFPSTPGAFQASRPVSTDTDSFVIKLTPTGRYAYATNLGDNREDQGKSIAVDPQGQAWVGGLTESDNFPVTPDAYQAHRVRTETLPTDGFVTGISATGAAEVYSTLLTGSGRLNIVRGIAVDDSGVVVAGQTTSADFPDSPGGLSSGFCCTGNEFAPDGFLAGLR